MLRGGLKWLRRKRATATPGLADDIVWTQPLCECCFAAWTLGRGKPRREPVGLVHEFRMCLICGERTRICARIDPQLACQFPHARRAS